MRVLHIEQSRGGHPRRVYIASDLHGDPELLEIPFAVSVSPAFTNDRRQKVTLEFYVDAVEARIDGPPVYADEIDLAPPEFAIDIVREPLGYATPAWANGEKVAVVRVASGAPLCARCEKPCLDYQVEWGPVWAHPRCVAVNEYTSNGDGETVALPATE